MSSNKVAADDRKNLRFETRLGDEDDNFSRPILSTLQIGKYFERAKEKIKKSELKNQQLRNKMELFEAKRSSIMQETTEVLKSLI